MMPNVAYTHSEYQKYYEEWELLRDCFQGAKIVKDKGEDYLPKPSGKDNKAYLKYIMRAIYYGAVRKTVVGVNGTIFRKPPQMELPPSLEFLFVDSDGYGTPIDQLAKKACEECILMGRLGLLVDFPSMPENIRRDEELAMNAKALINVYETEEIINWRYEQFGGKFQLVLVVLREFISEYGDDQFEPDEILQYRVLELDETGKYRATIWQEVESEFSMLEVFEPRKSNGERFDYIPFQFVGSNDLTADVDPSPMLDIAHLSIAHYRNSADFEEALFIVGQPTPIITGLSEKYIEEYSGKLIIGSRAAWLLPKDSTASLLEVKRDLSVLDNAMKRKEGQMVAVGAKLFEPVRGGVETAEAIRLRQINEASTISSIAMNVSKAFQISLKWVADWMGEPDLESIQFSLNSDFFAKRLEPNELKELMNTWQNGGITQRTLFNNLVTGEIIAPDEEFENYQEELADEKPALNAAELDLDEEEDQDEEEENQDDEILE